MRKVMLIQGATKEYKEKLLFKDITISLEHREIVGVLGRNGSGKSTLLEMIFGRNSWTKGNLFLNGLKMNPKEVIAAQCIGYLPQQGFLPSGAKVSDVIGMYFEKEHVLDKIFYAPRIAEMVKQRVGKLSVGERRYLEILLIGHLGHDFLLLDEPFSMVEPMYIEYIKKFLNELKKDKGILITDHYYEDVLDITDRNYVMFEQRLERVTSIAELKTYNYI